MNLYDKSSLILVPSGVKASKVYSQRPENGSGDFTFSRVSVANRINEDGVLEQVASNVPRLDYSDSSCPSLLLEPQRTNGLLQSNSFDKTWITSGYNITGGQSGIYGSNNAWLIEKISPTSNEYIRQNVSVSNFGASIYAKANTAPSLILYCNGGYATWNLKTGTLLSGGGGYTGHSIEPVGNGWYRLFVSGPSAINYYLQPKDATGQRTSGSVYIQHAQIEEGAYPTSIIETTTTQVTRNNDGGLTTIGSFSDVFGSSSLTQYAIFISLNKATQAQAGSATLIPLGTNAQGRINYAGGNRIAYYSTATGYATESFVTDGNPHKYLLVANNGSIKQFFDGLFVDEVNNPSDEFVSFSFLGASGNYADFDLASIIVFSKSLTDEEAIALTTL